MAHLHSGIMGPVSGKVGNLVYYTYRGKCFVRRAPVKSKKGPTLKQKSQRAKFGEAMRFVSPLSKLINESYRFVNRRKTGTNVLVKEILKDAIIGKYPHFFIDYPKVSLLRGNLPWAMGAMHPNEGTCNLEFSWQVFAQSEYLEDQLLLLVRCCTTGNWYTTEGNARRAHGSCTLRIEAPDNGGMLQVWMAFRSPDHRAYSNSEYLGEVMINKSSYYEN